MDWLIHAIFAIMFAAGLYLILDKSPKDQRTKEEVALSRFFCWGFVAINGARWAVFFAPMLMLGG